jgi:flagellar motor switch protein FliN/FliY
MSNEAMPVTSMLENFRAETQSSSGASLVGLGDIMDLPVLVSLEVGRTNISIRELLQLTAGSVIGLERDTSEAFDVLVNGTLVAHGEAVVVNDRCAIRFTEVIRAAGHDGGPGQ